MERTGCVLLLVCTFYVYVSCLPIEDVKEIVIQMPPTSVTEKDTYLCHAEPIADNDQSFVVAFDIRAYSKCVHHAVVAACEEYGSNVDTWDCKSQQGHICSGRSIVFGNWDGWSKHHEKHVFPDDVSVNMGKTSSLKHLVMQAHYSKPWECQDERAANISLFVSRSRRPYTFQALGMGSTGHIPANAIGFHAESACLWKGVPVYAYLYVVHTHTRGLFVEGYRVRDGKWTLIGEGKPVRNKERAQVSGGPLEIRPGDYVAARCTFDNTENREVLFGAGGNNEMCNFDVDIKYSTDDEQVYPTSIKCFKDATSFHWKEFIGSLPPMYDARPRR